MKLHLLFVQFVMQGTRHLFGNTDFKLDKLLIRLEDIVPILFLQIVQGFLTMGGKSFHMHQFHQGFRYFQVWAL